MFRAPMQKADQKLTCPSPKEALIFTYLQYNAFENTVGKGEIVLSLEESKIYRLGKGYTGNTKYKNLFFFYL